MTVRTNSNRKPKNVRTRSASLNIQQYVIIYMRDCEGIILGKRQLSISDDV